MPEGIRCSTVFLPPMTSVCPALCPPWKRTTPRAWSVSQSTILPLPSSPHWVPTTTTFFAIALSVLESSCTVHSAAALRPSLRSQLRARRASPAVPRQVDDDHVPRARKRRRCAAAGARRAARTARARPERRVAVGHRLRELAQVHAEAGRRARASERLADLVVAAAAARARSASPRRTPRTRRRCDSGSRAAPRGRSSGCARRRASCVATAPRARRARARISACSRQLAPRRREHFGTAVELGQRRERLARSRRSSLRVRALAAPARPSPASRGRAPPRAPRSSPARRTRQRKIATWPMSR